MNLENHVSPYGRAVVRLFKGPVESDNKLWNDILHYQTEIQKYVSQIGLELIIKREEGFAYLKQMEDEDGNTIGLVPRKQLGFEVSVILIILRQILEEFDSDLNELYANERFITPLELREHVEMFLPERFNRVRMLNELDNYISRIVQLGFLKEHRQDSGAVSYQIHRIIKEKVTLDKLQDFKDKLNEYAESV